MGSINSLWQILDLFSRINCKLAFAFLLRTSAIFKASLILLSACRRLKRERSGLRDRWDLQFGEPSSSSLGIARASSALRSLVRRLDRKENKRWQNVNPTLLKIFTVGIYRTHLKVYHLQIYVFFCVCAIFRANKSLLGGGVCRWNRNSWWGGAEKLMLRPPRCKIC